MSGSKRGSFSSGLYCSLTCGVSIIPSIMMWATWIPFGQYSLARESAIPLTPNLALLNARAPALPRIPEVAPVKSRAPPPLFCISGTAFLVHRNAPKTVTLQDCSNCSADRSSSPFHAHSWRG